MYQIQKMDRTSLDFYTTMGPIFGSRQIAKEVGINIYDDSDKQFFVCSYGNYFAGCISARGNVISDCYTIPKHRFNGVLTQLLNVVLDGMEFAKATCTQSSKGVFEKAGFRAVKELKNFTIMEYKKNA